jgi:pilus assembly protein CpaF
MEQPGSGPSTLTQHLEAEPELSLSTLVELARRQSPLASPHDAEQEASAVAATVHGLGIVDRLLTMPDVNEIMINGPGRVWVERGGRLYDVPNELSHGQLDLIVERILSPLGLRLDRLHPIVDGRLTDGSRVNVVARPLAIDGPLLSIRRFAPRPLPLDAFGPDGLVELLATLVKERRSILVVGATSAGKTSLLNSLSLEIDEGERLVTIEDTAELRLAGSHVVRLESRPPNSEGVGAVSLRQLVITALRMRPDRLIVGEVRGAEAFDLLLALTAGHHGSLCTCHALGAQSGLRRLQMLASLADAELSPGLIRSYVVDAIDVVVHVERMAGGRRVESVWQVAEAAESRPRADGFQLECLWSVPSTDQRAHDG